MDRNILLLPLTLAGAVALRKESVDRNYAFPAFYRCFPVALRKESVDRNFLWGATDMDMLSSLSARRAWIEILASGINPDQSGVALRKESVDRNIGVA